MTEAMTMLIPSPAQRSRLHHEFIAPNLGALARVTGVRFRYSLIVSGQHILYILQFYKGVYLQAN